MSIAQISEINAAIRAGLAALGAAKLQGGQQ